jgi:hypothetical protein
MTKAAFTAVSVSAQLFVSSSLFSPASARFHHRNKISVNNFFKKVITPVFDGIDDSWRALFLKSHDAVEAVGQGRDGVYFKGGFFSRFQGAT